MGDFLAFRKMITPTLAMVLFWMGVVVCVVMGITMLTAGKGGVPLGVALLFIGPLLVRVYCETLILVFRVYEVLVEIRDGKTGESS